MLVSRALEHKGTLMSQGKEHVAISEYMFQK
jgi:hypothetical protein